MGFPDFQFSYSAIKFSVLKYKWYQSSHAALGKIRNTYIPYA